MASEEPSLGQPITRTVRLLVKVLTLGLLLSVLAIGARTGAPLRVFASHDPTDFFLRATANGWNATTTGLCSPSGTDICNPHVREFRGVIFSVTIQGADRFLTHNLAVYPKNYPPEQVFLGSFAALARSANVGNRDVASLSFTPTLPNNDFAGTSGLEYYCEFHPDTMHARATVFKSPDLTGDGSVTILDISPMAFAFGSTPGAANWDVSSDIDNDGDVDIVDIATAAIYFDEVLVD